MSFSVAAHDTGHRALRRRAAHIRHEASDRFWRLFAVSAFSFVLFGANLHLGTAVLTSNIGGVSVAQSNIPEDGRTAQIRRPLLDGTVCRSIIYDTQVSQSIEDKVKRCDKLRAARSRQSTHFSWGNR